MKLVITLVAFSALLQDAALGFSTQKTVRPTRSALQMTVEEAEQKDVRVGVIGCGRIGLVHLEAIGKAPGVTPVIVSNPTVSKAKKGKTKQCWSMRGSCPLTKQQYTRLHYWELRDY